jgi:hypothetical protein
MRDVIDWVSAWFDWQRAAIVRNRNRVFAPQKDANLLWPPFPRDVREGDLQQMYARRRMLVSSCFCE